MDEIRIEGVAKRFGDVQALGPIDLTILPSQFVSILGPSGCGKTTLLRSLAGLVDPDEGSIHFGDRAVFDAARNFSLPPQRRGIGMVFQDLALWPHLTVFENVAFPLRAARRTADLAQRVAEALDRVRLPDHGHRHPHELSGGQQQRVSLARAIVAKPALLLMDEPLSALDASLRLELRAELTTLVHDLGLTTVFVTHDQAEAMAMSDRVVVMNAGSVVQDAPPEVLYRNPTGSFVAGFVGSYNPVDPSRLETSAASAGIRPERLRFDGRPGDLVFEVEVDHASYLGDRYEVRCRLAGAAEPWTVYSDQRFEPGQQIRLFAAIEDVMTLAAER